MNAISPFSLLDRARTGLSAVATSAPVQRIATEVQRHSTQTGGIGSAFSDTWSKLDINDDGKLTAADAAGHVLAVGARLVGGALGVDIAVTPADARASGPGSADAAGHDLQTRATGDSAVMRAASDAREGAMMLNGLLHRDSSTPPRVEAIRAAYSALRAERGYGAGLG